MAEGQLEYWQNLRTQAESGELRVEKEVGEKLARHCEELIRRLNIMINDATDLQYVSGFGGLQSAQDLASKFARKAFVDDDSAVNRLTEALEIAKLMKATYELAIRNLDATDQQTAGQLGDTGADI